MNELPVIGPCVCPKISWIETGQTLQAAKGCSTSKKTILERDQCFFAAVLLQMDKDNVNSREL